MSSTLVSHSNIPSFPSLLSFSSLLPTIIYSFFLLVVSTVFSHSKIPSIPSLIYSFLSFLQISLTVSSFPILPSPSYTFFPIQLKACYFCFLYFFSCLFIHTPYPFIITSMENIQNLKGILITFITPKIHISISSICNFLECTQNV